MSRPNDLALTPISDQSINENFDILRRYVDASLFGSFLGRFMVISLDGAKSNIEIGHGLNFKPEDVIVTSRIGPGTVTFHYEDFDRDYLILSSTDAVTVRAFVGSYMGDL